MKIDLRKIGILILATASITMCGCSKKIIYNNVIGPQYDVRKDGKKALFSYYLNNLAEIREIDLDTRDIKVVTKIPSKSCIRPKYINDKDIIFISTSGSRKKKLSSIWILKDGVQKEILKDIPYDIEAVYSPINKRIYAAIPKYYGHYSPIVSSRAHEYDLYSFADDGTDKQTNTHLDAYSMGNLHLRGEMIYFEIAGTDDSKQHLMCYNITTKNLNDVFSRENAYYYAISHDNKYVAYSMPINTAGMYQYELHITNIVSAETKQLTNLNKSVGISMFSDMQTVIFLCQENFRKFPERYEFYKVAIDGTGLTKV